MAESEIEVLLKIRDLASKELDNFDRRTRKTGRDAANSFKKVDGAAASLAKRIGLLAVSFVGVAQALRGIRAGITAGFGFVELAGDAEEARSKFEELFGDAVPEANAQLELLAANLNRSTGTLRDAASDLKALLGPLGFASEDANALSFEIVQLAQDVESFRNTRFDTVLRDIRSGLIGQSEPLLKYGADIREASTAQEALRLGLKDTAKELTPQDKQIARLSIIYQAFEKDIGDVQRTSDSYANSLRALREAQKDIRTELGQGLIVVLKEAIADLGGAAKVTNDYRFVATAAAFVTTGFIRAVVSLIKAARTLADAFGGTQGTVGSLKKLGVAVAVLTGAFQVLVESIVFLGVTAKNNFTTIARLATKNFKGIALGLDILINAFNKLAGSTEVSRLADNFKESGSVLGIVADGVKANAEAVKAFGLGIARAGLEAQKLKNDFDNVSTAFGKLVEDTNLDKLIPGLPVIGGALDAALNRAVTKYREAFEEIRTETNKQAGLIEDTIERIGQTFSDEALVAGFAQGLFGIVERGLGDLSDALVEGELNFRDFASGIAKSIGKLITQFLLLRAARQALGFDAFGELTGGGLASLFSVSGLAKGGVMSGSMGNPVPVNAYANGGVANSPQLALFGEGRGAEAFVPLPDGKNIPVKMEGGGGGPVNVSITVPALDPQTAAEVIKANLPTITQGVALAIESGQDRKLIKAVGRG